MLKQDTENLPVCQLGRPTMKSEIAKITWIFFYPELGSATIVVCVVIFHGKQNEQRYDQARSQGGSRGVPGNKCFPQAIQGIVNTLFWLYCGFNFSESKNQTVATRW